MSFLLLKANNNRFALFDKRTENFVGLLIAPLPDESADAFTREFGSTYDRGQIKNIDEFPELSELKYFAIEYLRPGDPF